MPQTSSDKELYIVAGIVMVLVAIGVLVWLAQFFNRFSMELRHLNNEIRRTKGSERRYWKRRRRRLWLSLLPFMKY